MGIKSQVYVKIEETSFKEDGRIINGEKLYIATCIVAMYRDESKGSLFSRQEIKLENLTLEKLDLPNMYSILMNHYIGSEEV